MSNVQDFKENDWTFERQSGFDGYRNKTTNEWIYADDYSQRERLKGQYLADYELLHQFRLDHLPFGEYPDCVIQEFLHNKYNKKWKNYLF